MTTDLAFNRVEIDLAALKANYRLLKDSGQGRPLMAVVKGDAYGHGLLACAQSLVAAGANDLGVLDVLEGLALKKILPATVNIYVLAGLLSREQILAALNNQLVMVVYSAAQLKLILDLIPPGGLGRAYLKIDTGMGRLGLSTPEAMNLLPLIVKNDRLVIMGLMTHLATAGDYFATAQLNRFQGLIDLDQKIHLTQGRHSALAGPGFLSYPNYVDQLSRVGLLLYGANPLSDSLDRIANDRLAVVQSLQPVMSFSSQIIQIRTVKAKESLSYDRTFVAPTDLKVAAAPVGYVHGLNRSRSNRGYALINGQKARLLGRVCMNLCLFDVSEIPNARVGQKVVLLGRAGSAQIQVEELAAWQGTNAYETLCLIGRLNPRSFINDKSD
ncbi:MAG: alanine racemase [Deltaproteobacteria bacterium]|jgi:alanine racemase|nr:alanine racemase [Deltaproteobacteria bacterium]